VQVIITMVDAGVAPENVEALLQAWGRETGGALPRGLKESYLLRAGDAWRITTVWESREALEEMRRTTQTPGALLIFRAAGAEPTLTVFEVAGHIRS